MNRKPIVLLIVLLGLFYQVESLPTYRSAAQENKSADGQTSPPTIEKPLTAKDTAASSNNTEPTADKIKRAEWVQIGLNSFIALVIFWQAWTYSQQRKIMQIQTDNAHITQRAYLGVKGAEMEKFTLGEVPVVRVTVLNGGQTPAFKLKAPGILSVGTEFPHERPEIGGAVSSTVLPAGVDMTFSYPFTFILTPAWLQAFQKGERLIFVHGEAHFEDCWGEAQVFSYKLAYRAADGRWGDYKDPDEVKAKITVTP